MELTESVVMFGNILSADVSKIQYCEVVLTAEKYQAFVYAVKNHYWYQMYIDDLPIWGKLDLDVNVW